jgi:hypothetical protein
MDSKRLEELAEWAQSQADWCAGQDLPPDIGGKYADLARCAKAWAKVERLKRKGKWILNYVCGCVTLACGYTTGDSTAIAAVEASPEVKP